VSVSALRLYHALIARGSLWPGRRLRDDTPAEVAGLVLIAACVRCGHWPDGYRLTRRGAVVSPDTLAADAEALAGPWWADAG
jgi:hypothetical protein